MVKKIAITAYVLGVLFTPLTLVRAALMCDVPRFDFGVCAETDGGFSHAFEVCNTGTTAIVISAVRSSCDCLTAEMVHQTLAPRERTVVDAHLLFDGLSGIQTRVLHLAYRGVDTPEAPLQVLSLVLEGFVLTPVLCLPSILDFGVVLPGGIATGTVQLLSGRVGPFTLQAVGFDSQQDRADYVPGLLATNHAVFLEIHPPARTGVFSGRALVTTDLDECPQVALPYRGQVAPLIEARPSVIAAHDNVPLDARVAFSSAHKIPFRVLAATATDPRIHTEVQDVADGVSVHVTSLIAGSSLVDALVRVTTDHPVCRVIEIPVRVSSPRGSGYAKE